jgi:hypothetical protein
MKNKSHLTPGWTLEEVPFLSEITTTLYVVVSAIDDNTHGPFFSRSDALVFAEPVDGSVFKCTARLIDIRREV